MDGCSCKDPRICYERCVFPSRPGELLREYPVVPFRRILARAKPGHSHMKRRNGKHQTRANCEIQRRVPQDRSQVIERLYLLAFLSSHASAGTRPNLSRSTPPSHSTAAPHGPRTEFRARQSLGSSADPCITRHTLFNPHTSRQPVSPTPAD